MFFCFIDTDNFYINLEIKQQKIANEEETHFFNPTRRNNDNSSNKPNFDFGAHLPQAIGKIYRQLY